MIKLPITKKRGRKKKKTLKGHYNTSVDSHNTLEAANNGKSYLCWTVKIHPEDITLIQHKPTHTHNSCNTPHSHTHNTNESPTTFWSLGNI